MKLHILLTLLIFAAARHTDAQTNLLDPSSGRIPQFDLFTAHGVVGQIQKTPEGVSLKARFATGDWVSLRTQAASPFAFAVMNSVALTLDIQSDGSFSPRVTLADRAEGKEEFWWVDFPAVAPGTHRLCANLDAATLSYGDGSRQNDHRLDRAGIDAVEVNFTRPGGTRGSQHLTVLLTELTLHSTDNCTEN